ncbi:MAG: glycosyltransferase family 2 protein [Flavobacteriaceae bacterium]|jgi:glycosyltransferase involved in cell wall biosynthesis|nr:glycosyltransferase family 2 protein [Flavobacteriaceae bacterium]MDG1911815.1 glycosyltransferase family 2 protein [Flavobacteriaceae bacterium]
MQNAVDISLVIPLLNEEESLVPLHQWIAEVFSNHKHSYEVIFIDDGSSDESWKVITSLAESNSTVKGIQFVRNFGKSQALHAGFELAQGNYIVTLDADLQDSPEEIPNLINTLIEQKLDLISGWKKKRFDSFLFKNLPSKLFNWAARRVSGIYLHDFNCGLKAYRKEVVKTIDVHGEMHRYIPVLAANEGFNKIGEQVVQHQARQFGHTKFGADRFFKGFLDLITLWFINRFGKQPMHFFGLWGTLMLLVGFGFTLYLGIDKLFFNIQARLITERPEFYIALTLMLLGSQFFIAGFLGEIILRSQRSNNRYNIKTLTKTK